MFEDYKKAVLDSYLSKKAMGQLSTNLESPNRTKLKRECLVVFAKRYSKRDDDMLQSFFDATNKFNDHIKSIEKFDLDKFRPMVSLLTTGKNVRDELNIKLLAWLINFPGYEDWRINPIVAAEPIKVTETPDDDKEKNIETVVISPTQEESLATAKDPRAIKESKDEEKTSLVKQPRLTFNKAVVLCIVLVLASGIVYLNTNKIGAFNSLVLSGQEKCMYWSGNHYEALDCNQKGLNVHVVPLNIALLNNFKKITMPDTLTSNSLGKVWYSKQGSKIDFYTDSSAHPTDSNKRLKPITPYMLANHVSYYRYLLTMLAWAICAIVLVILCIVYLKFFKKKSKNHASSQAA